MSDKWRKSQIGDCLLLHNDKAKQIKSTEYESSGTIPVIDQSDKFIAGYTSQVQKQYLDPLPVVVFGDHTRHVKFIDFNFVAGADGTQIIRGIREVDQKYFYYLVCSASEAIGNYGYDRHFKHLKKIEVIFPNSIVEQKRIAKILTCIDQTIAKTEALIHKYQQIKTGLMHDLFTRGITVDGKLRPPRKQAPELYKETPIGWIPKEWDLVNASEICHTITKGTTPSYFLDSSNGQATIPFIRVENLTFDGSLKFEGNSLFISKTIHDSELSRSKVFSGDILMNIVGPPLGKVSLITDEYEELNANQAVAIFRVIKQKHRGYLLYYLISELAQKWFYIYSKRTSGQVNLTLEMCSNLEIPFPQKEPELEDISNILAKIFKKIDNENNFRAKLLKLKSGLMHDLLTGKVQVSVN